jgi:hypothetical protein
MSARGKKGGRPSLGLDEKEKKRRKAEKSKESTKEKNEKRDDGVSKSVILFVVGTNPFGFVELNASQAVLTCSEPGPAPAQAFVKWFMSRTLHRYDFLELFKRGVVPGVGAYQQTIEVPDDIELLVSFKENAEMAMTVENLLQNPILLNHVNQLVGYFLYENNKEVTILFTTPASILKYGMDPDVLQLIVDDIDCIHDGHDTPLYDGTLLPDGSMRPEGAPSLMAFPRYFEVLGLVSNRTAVVQYPGFPLHSR